MRCASGKDNDKRLITASYRTLQLVTIVSIITLVTAQFTLLSSNLPDH